MLIRLHTYFPPGTLFIVCSKIPMSQWDPKLVSKAVLGEETASFQEQ